MSRKERERKAVFELVKQSHINLAQCARRLGLSYRQVLRSWQRYNSSGDSGLVHKSRGRASNRRLEYSVEQAIITYYQTHLSGFEPTFASEKLALAGLLIKAETLRRLLIRNDLWRPKKRKAKYRTKRQRRQSFGELVQLDGSFHDWFDDGDEHCLMNMIDDSSSTTLAELHDEETTEAAMRVLWAWIDKYGIPQALYTDKRNVYITDREPTIDEQLAGIQPLTAFGKCCKELGIEIITAHSPQAKGRVERSNGTYQNRFIKELKFQGVNTVEAANTLLRESFCDDLNQRFALPITSDIHRAIGQINLYDVFVWQQERVVSNDWTIRYNNQVYQLSDGNCQSLKPKKKITVITHIDGKLSMRFQGQKIAFKQIEQRQSKKKGSRALSSAQRAEYGRKGAKNSPWGQYNPNWLKKQRGAATYPQGAQP